MDLPGSEWFGQPAQTHNPAFLRRLESALFHARVLIFSASRHGRHIRLSGNGERGQPNWEHLPDCTRLCQSATVLAAWLAFLHASEPHSFLRGSRMGDEQYVQIGIMLPNHIGKVQIIVPVIVPVVTTQHTGSGTVCP